MHVLSLGILYRASLLALYDKMFNITHKRIPLKKLLSILSISALTLLLSVGCASTHSSEEAHSGDYQKLSNKQIHQAIMRGGEKAGWKMTEFKDNEVIAEKIEDGDSEMVSVKIHNGHVSYEGEASHSDLEDAIYEALHSNGSEH